MTTDVARIVLALAVVSGAVLAVIPLIRGPRNRLRWSFSAGMAGFALESAAALMLVVVTETPEERLLWLRTHHATSLMLLVPWAAFTLALATPWWRPFPRPAKRALLAGGMLAAAAAAAGVHPLAFDIPDVSGAFYAARLGMIATAGTIVQILGTVGILAGLEAALRTSRGEARWRTKYLVVGLGGIFLVRFYFLSQAALFNVLFAGHLTATAATLLVGGVVIAVSLTRDRLGIEVVVSRQVVYRSVVVGILGFYLVAVGGLGWVLDQLGMADDLLWTSVVVFVSALGLAALLLSEAVRWRIKRFIGRNFYGSKYDYRQQWATFTTRLGSLVTVDELAPELLQTVADTVGTKSALLFLHDSADGRFHAVASVGVKRPATALDARWPLLNPAPQQPLVLEAGCPPHALEEVAPDAFPEGSVVVPLPWRGQLTGLMLLGPERTGTPYTGEDLEFLTTVAEQAAGAFATAQLSESLTRAREFEAFHRLTSFVVHDLKNSISALSMLSDNAARHFDDPEFQRDAMRTLERTVGRMKGLLGRLSASEGSGLRREPVDLVALVEEAAAPIDRSDRIKLVKDLPAGPPVLGDADALLRVAQNLVNNAAQAIEGRGTITVRTSYASQRVVLTVTDTGCGMSAEFVRRSLFSPFRTTKKGGWGIGLYQTKGIVEAHGGAIEVSSEEGAGTTFTVTLPIAREDTA